MNTKHMILALLAFSAIAVLPSVAAAADGWVVSWDGWGPRPYLSPSVYVQETPPYFALHPPVYYSRPVPRPYGALPYPYLPVSPCLSAPPPRPVVVVNPYVTGAVDATAQPVAQQSERIVVTYPTEMFEGPG